MLISIIIISIKNNNYSSCSYNSINIDNNKEKNIENKNKYH